MVRLESDQFLIVFASLVSIFSVIFVLSRGRYRGKYSYEKVKETRLKHENTFLISVLYWRFSTSLTYLLGKSNITANQISALSFVFGILVAAIFSVGIYPQIIAGGVLTLLLFIFDCVDGEIARLKNQASVFGLWVDHILGAGWNTLVYIGIIVGLITSGIDTVGLFIIIFFLLGYIMNYSVFIETRALLGKYPKEAVNGKLGRIAIHFGLKPNDLSLTGDIQASLVLLASIFNQMMFLILLLSIIFNIQWIIAFSLIYRQRQNNPDQNRTK